VSGAFLKRGTRDRKEFMLDNAPGGGSWDGSAKGTDYGRIANPNFIDVPRNATKSTCKPINTKV
jgi:hypothetical protein